MSEPAAPALLLDTGGVETREPTDDDIERALMAPRDDDWYVTLWRGEDDFIEAMLDSGELWVECEQGGRFLQARSHVDDATVKSMFFSFREGTGAWRDLAAWTEPPPRARQSAPPPVLAAVVGAVVAMVIASIVTAIVTDNAGWVVLMFALLFPGLIAAAAAVKVAQAQRAAAWAKASGKIVTSRLVTEKRNGKEIKAPRVEYEFTIAFHRYRGRRVNFAEVLAGPDAVATVARYPVGAAVPVYYDPANPTESVIERDLPPFFRAIWTVVAVLTVLILAVGWHYLLR